MIMPGNRTWNLNYNPAGQRTQVDLPNGMSTEYAYDGQGRLEAIAHKDSGGTTVEEYAYEYDKVGNITRQSSANYAADWIYSYDERYRLTQASLPIHPPWVIEQYRYTYDAGDNLIEKEHVGEFTRSFCYNAANELTEITEGSETTSFTYDALGRQTGKSRGSYSASYGYRYGARLHNVTTNFPGEEDATYDYAGDGMRRLKLMAGGDEIYRWDPLRGNLMHREEGPNHAETFVHDPTRLGGSVLAQISGSSAATGTAEHLLHDHLGSTRSLRSSSATEIWDREYTPYGATFEGASGDERFMFTGHQWDGETGLYYAPHRYYSPFQARWTTRDPLGMIDGPNVYAYVRGNPVNAVDVDGLFSQYKYAVNSQHNTRDMPVNVLSARPPGGLGGLISMIVSCVYSGEGTGIDSLKQEEVRKCLCPDRGTTPYDWCALACVCLADVCHAYIEANGNCPAGIGAAMLCLV